MRRLYIPTALLLLLLSGASLAQTSDDCRLKCSAEKDTRNAACPAAEAFADTQLAREQCLKESDQAYYQCVTTCPPATPATSTPSTPPPVAPPPTGY